VWSYGAGFWRCTVCMRLALSEELTAAHLREKCDGQKSTLAA
jgi:phage FluMu protein Com